MLIFVGLFILGFVTSFVGTNTGGSSLVTIPAMIAMGLPPAVAIASARVTSIGTLFAGLRAFHKQKKVDYKIALPAAILSIIGASTGAIIMAHVSTVFLMRIVGILTILLLSFSYFFRKRKYHTKPVTRKQKFFGYSLFLFTSMIGGFYGGQGIITTVIFVLFFNKTMSESAGTRKVSALAGNVGPCIIYAFYNFIDWPVVAALMSGTILGSTAGANYALKKGDAWIEKLFMIVAVLLAIKLLLTEVV